MGYSRLLYHSRLIQAKESKISWEIENKFGDNTAVGTSYVPITGNGIYRTPQVSGATTLRVKAGGDANDTAA